METMACAAVALMSTVQAFILVLIQKELRKQNGRRTNG